MVYDVTTEEYKYATLFHICETLRLTDGAMRYEFCGEDFKKFPFGSYEPKLEAIFNGDLNIRIGSMVHRRFKSIYYEVAIAPVNREREFSNQIDMDDVTEKYTIVNHYYSLKSAQKFVDSVCRWWDRIEAELYNRQR